MDESKALDIIRVLADGVDPETGEVFPADSPYRQPPTIRALHTEVLALETVEKQKQRKRKLPARAGEKWTSTESEKLEATFKSGTSIKDLAQNHQRTEWAIKSHLQKLGLVQPMDN